MTDTSQERFAAPPRSPDFEETTSAVTRKGCDGYRYDTCIEYDLASERDRLWFEQKLDTFIDWFEDARDGDGEVFANEEDGHRHFRVNGIEYECNVEEVSKQFRRIYFTVGPVE